MAHEVDWTKSIVERFAEEAMLSDLEVDILCTRIRGWSRTKQCQHFNLSMSTLDRMIRELKRKYDQA